MIKKEFTILVFRHGQSVSFNERSLSVLLKKNRCFCHKQIQIRCRVSTESILISVWNQTAHQNWWKHNLICTKATNKHICQMEFKCETASAWEWMAICRIWLKLLTRYCFFVVLQIKSDKILLVTPIVNPKQSYTSSWMTVCKMAKWKKRWYKFK